MKVLIDYTEVPRPVKGVTLHLTPQEWHDLQVIANIPSDQLQIALRYSRTLEPITRVGQSTTHDVYGLVKLIREAR